MISSPQRANRPRAVTTGAPAYLLAAEGLMGTTRPRLHELWLVLFVALFSVLSSAHVVVGKASLA